MQNTHTAEWIKKKKKKIKEGLTDAIGSIQVLGIISQDLFVDGQGSILVSLFLPRHLSPVNTCFTQVPAPS